MKKTKFGLIFFLGTSLFSLSSCDIALDEESFLDKLFPYPIDALAIFLAFIVLLVVVFFVAYKPVKELIKKRGDYVEGKIKDATLKEEKANEKLEKANEEIKASKVEARDIVEQAKKEAKLEKEQILKQAQKEKEIEVNKAKEEIAQEIEASKDELHKEIVSVALDASSKILAREVNSKDNEQLVNDFISELKDKK